MTLNIDNSTIKPYNSDETTMNNIPSIDNWKLDLISPETVTDEEITVLVLCLSVYFQNLQAEFDKSSDTDSSKLDSWSHVDQCDYQNPTDLSRIAKNGERWKISGRIETNIN